MLVLELLVEFFLLLLIDRAFTFLLNLTVKLLLDQASSLMLSGNMLLLLFVVEKSVELLDGGPLVFLLELTVDGLSIDLTGSYRVCISVLLRSHAHGLRAASGTGN